MKKKYISIQPYQFLSELMDIIPSNCIINKVLTGIGATSLEISSQRHSIIIEPNVPVIRGKRITNKMVLGVCEGIYTQDIIAYLLNDNIKFKKILTTPESFIKVKQAIKEIGYNMFTEFFLLFDECDRLTTDIDYRESIVLPLDDFFRFKNKALISATAREISDERFMNFEILEIVPTFNYSRTLNLFSTNNPKSAFQLYCKELKDIEDETPICIFFNSIDGILSLISELQIDKESAIFCSENGEEKIRKNMITVSTDIKPSKMKRFNFFTARFFSAVDIQLDYRPHVVFLTDLNIALHSLLDPYSDMIQIAGRFRNGTSSLTQITNFNEEIPHLTNDEAITFLNTNKQVYTTIQTLRDTSDSQLAKRLINDLLASIFFSRFYTDDEKFNYFMYDNYLLNESKKGYYRSVDKLIKALSDDRTGKYFNIALREISFETPSIYTNNLDFRVSFHEIVVKIANILEGLSAQVPSYAIAFDNRSSVYQEVNKRHPTIVKAYEILGYERLVQYGYTSAMIAREIRKFNEEMGVENTSFRSALNICFEVGKYYRQKEMLDKFYELSKGYKLPFKREISELERFFELGKLKSTPYAKCRFIISKKFND